MECPECHFQHAVERDQAGVYHLSVLTFRGRFPPDPECSVCLEVYTDSGDHTCRRLLCNHTVCDLCLKQIVRNNRMECPECRFHHTAVKQGDSGVYQLKAFDGEEPQPSTPCPKKEEVIPLRQLAFGEYFCSDHRLVSVDGVVIGPQEHSRKRTHVSHMMIICSLNSFGTVVEGFDLHWKVS